MTAMLSCIALWHLVMDERGSILLLPLNVSSLPTITWTTLKMQPLLYNNDIFCISLYLINCKNKTKTIFFFICAGFQRWFWCGWEDQGHVDAVLWLRSAVCAAISHHLSHGDVHTQDYQPTVCSRQGGSPLLFSQICGRYVFRWRVVLLMLLLCLRYLSYGGGEILVWWVLTFF